MTGQLSASARQVLAADPARSTWVSANAGSGKTRVLTDRVARLLLDGTDPGRILCLTYTKAAAAEMQTRLFGLLGKWAMLPDDALRDALRDLGLAGPVPAGQLAQARRLFAQAIETPGGLRILTIHAFCAALLRRFPLEAGVSPAFADMDDRAATLLRADIIEDMAERLAPDAVTALAARFTGETLEGVAKDIAGRRPAFDPPLDAAGCRALFGVPEGESLGGIVADVLGPGGTALLAGVIPVMAAGSANDVKAAEKLMLFDAQAPDLWVLEDVLLLKENKADPARSFTAKIGGVPTRPTAARLGPLLPLLEALMRRVEAGRARRLALAAAERTALLHAFAAAFLLEYARRKADRGLLDFDDLILRARDLLTDPSVAQWVLFRLDGGIDHILVDEAQDTSPLQWQVIEALTAEFTAGEGAGDRLRTLFVVGDRKQSIYSFQGADLATFAARETSFALRFAAIGADLQRVGLEHSFRSAPTILRLVDATFDARRGRSLDGSGHIAFHAAMPGRAELWAPVLPAAKPEPGDWWDPRDLPSEEHHAARLGAAVAERITAMLASGARIPTKDGPRPVGPGDILILVRRRSGGIFDSVIGACKAAGLPVAGADRLKLGAELAVKDIIAVLSFLALPENDLSLAAALRSPLIGWTEGQLYDLAQGRPGYLWQALRASGDHAPTMAILEDLRLLSDFLRPYDLIERLLTRHDGRRRLIARLGPEASDGIDEMLSQALAYERQAVPSLTGFLVWLEADAIEVKRQLDAGRGRIRVITVHGAKGLEAPVVILPDTAPYERPGRGDLVALAGGRIAWRVPRTDQPPAMADAVAEARARDEAESRRLLYVAMTRAQSWLIVAMAGNPGREAAEGDDRLPAWYQQIRDGMTDAGADVRADGGMDLIDAHWPEDAAGPSDSAAADSPAVLPGWSVQVPAEPHRTPQPLLPSGLGGAKALPGEEGLDADAALARGTRLHRLLEVLPGMAPHLWPEIAAQVLNGADDAEAALAEARRILHDPNLSHVFAPGTMAEVPVCGTWAGRAMQGTIDRLVIGPASVLAVDYKTNRTLPATPEAVPEGLLRQMGAYAHLLAQVFPGRTVEMALLWTSGPRLMPLPGALLRGALERAPVP